MPGWLIFAGLGGFILWALRGTAKAAEDQANGLGSTPATRVQQIATLGKEPGDLSAAQAPAPIVLQSPIPIVATLNPPPPPPATWASPVNPVPSTLPAPIGGVGGTPNAYAQPAPVLSPAPAPIAPSILAPVSLKPLPSDVSFIAPTVIEPQVVTQSVPNTILRGIGIGVVTVPSSPPPDGVAAVQTVSTIPTRIGFGW